MLGVKTSDERIVAVRHDVVEDTSVTMDDLRREGFSKQVLEALASVTKVEGEDYGAFVRRPRRLRSSDRPADPPRT